jgi:flagellar motility protein MotE (MotC chaperone)
VVDELESKEEETESPATEKKSGSLINMKNILIGAGAFIVFVAIFSFVLGVFSSTSAPVTEHPATEEATHSKVAATDDNENQHGSDGWNDDYSNDHMEDDSLAIDTIMSEEDSIRHVQWYDAQKLEIEKEKIQIRAATGRLQALKIETETLLNQRKNLETTSIANMAKLFETMKANDVAAIMENIPNVKVGLIIQKMKKQSASKVMASLPSKRAARITMELIDLGGNY